MDVAGSGLLEIAAEYEAFRLGKEVDGAQYREADAQWFRAILSGVVENQKTVDPVIRQALTEDWPLSRLDSTLRAILQGRRLRTDEARGRAGRRHRFGICRHRQGLLFGGRAEAGQRRARPRIAARPGRGTRQGRVMTARTPAEREARRTALILAAVAGDRRLGRRGRVFAWRDCRPLPARRRQVAGDGAHHRLQRRRGARRNSRGVDHPQARPAQRLPGRNLDHGAWRNDGDVRAVPVELLDCSPPL